MHMRLNIKSTLPLLTSFAMHAFVLILFGVSLSVTEKSVRLGDPDMTVVKSYIWQDKFTVNRTPVDLSSSGRKSSRSMQQNNLRSHAKSTRHERSHGEQTQTLLSLLHAAIQQQQHYPQSARDMGREGRVTVAFTLLKDGSIRRLRLIKSSQTATLDEAAITAVQNAAPFREAKQYLNDMREFNIDIVFALS